MVDVLSRSYDNQESGSNTQETILTAPNVGRYGIRRLFTLQTEGDARGCEAQPLILTGLTVAGVTRNVCILATMANGVYGYDADTGELLWERTLGEPVKATQAIDFYMINDHIGILSTPVIDPATNTIYVCAWVAPSGTTKDAQHWLFAVSAEDGSDHKPPLNLEGVVYKSQMFKSASRKQRPGLLLTDVGGYKTVFVGFGSLSESSATSRGWIIAVDLTAWGAPWGWASTISGSGAGIWQGGSSLTADAQGNIYVITGNGDFNGADNFGECIVKLNYYRTSGFNVVWAWSPFSDNFRTSGGPKELKEEHKEPRAVNYRGYAKRDGLKAMAMSEWGDMDLGSAGPLPIPDLGIVVGGGKDGVLYACHMDGQPNTDPADLAAPAGSARNYAKLVFPPIFFTYYTPNLSPAPDDIRTLNTLEYNLTHHIHGAPIYWKSPDHGPMLFCWGENGNLRAWAISKTGIKYLASGAEQASAQSPAPPGGMPGGMLCLSAPQERGSGVVWACIPYTDANSGISAGRLLAYDATRFNGQQMVKLWDSQDWGLGFAYSKFNRPVVANGKLYVPNYSGGVDVYGLAK